MKESINLLFRQFIKYNFKAKINVMFTSLLIQLIALAILVSSNSYSLHVINNKNLILRVGIFLSISMLLILFICYGAIMKELHHVAEYAKLLSSGKLDTDDIIIKGYGDISILSKAVNDMKDNLLFFIDDTKVNTLVLSESIDKVSKGMDMSCVGNEQVARVMQEIAYKSQEQLNVVQDTASKTDEAYKSIDAISIHIKDVERIASDTNSASLRGKESLNTYDKNVNTIYQGITDISKFISELELSAKEIEKVVEFIVGLSRQLKLLSLNASVEAARAGEEGKGFAIVAQEITKLSDATNEGIYKINEIVTNILQNSDKVEGSINKSVNDFEKGKQIFSNVNEIFNEINEKNNVILDQVREIDLQASFIIENIKNIVTLSQNVNESSKAVSQGTEEAVAVIEEELAEFQQINSTMATLQQLLGKIEKSTSKFDVDITPVKENPTKQLRIAAIIPAFGGFWDNFRLGAIYAKKSLEARNAIIEIIPLNTYSAEDLATSISRCIQLGFDGIALPGFHEDKIHSIINNSVPIITFNSDFRIKENRLAFVGQNAYKSGEAAAETLVEQIGGSGRIVIVASDKRPVDLELRREGFRNLIRKNKKIKILDELEVPFDYDMAYKIFKDFLKRNSNISGVFVCGGGQKGIARVIEEFNLSGKVKVIVYDTTKDNLDNVNRGVFTCTIGQDPFRQGHDPIIYLYNYIVKGEKPDIEKTWTRIQIININNVKYFLN